MIGKQKQYMQLLRPRSKVMNDHGDARSVMDFDQSKAFCELDDDPISTGAATKRWGNHF